MTFDPQPSGPSSVDGPDAVVDALAAEFVARRRRGERVEVEDYAAAHPPQAKAIRELFPTILALEGMRLRQEAPATGRASLGPRRPKRLGDFTIVRQIGSGGMGVVYEAIQESLGRRVAVKVLSRHEGGDERRRRRFLQEAGIAGRLHHTNIVPVLGVGTADDLDYFAMQYIDGHGLDRVVAELRLTGDASPARVPLPVQRPVDDATTKPTQDFAQPTLADEPDAPPVVRPTPWRPAAGYWRDVARIGAQAARALAHAHSQGVLHRDVKPANLLLDREGAIWVADFGLAKVVDQRELTRTGDLVGTWLYASPEHASGAVDCRSDVYSLGLTLFELATLALPFDRTARWKAALERTTAPAGPTLRELAPEIPFDLETILLKAIALEPPDRYIDADALAEDLERFLDDRAPMARRQTLWERWRRWARRSPNEARLTAASAALLLVAAVATTSGWIATGSSLRRESAERVRAEKSVAIARSALDEAFDRLDAERGAGDVAAGPAVVSPENAALLERLLPLYERLIDGEETRGPTNSEYLRSIERLGDIWLRLGEHDKATTAYQRAISRIEIGSSAPIDWPRRQVLARLKNQLGLSLARAGRIDDARAAHADAARQLESDGSAADAIGDAPIAARVELARALYLAGRHIKPLQPRPLERNVPPDHPFDGPPGPPPPERMTIDRALALLEPLAADETRVDARYLTALCLRETLRREPIPRDERCRELLASVVAARPAWADARLEWSESLAGFDVRRLPPPFVEEGLQRLGQAVELTRRLVDEHPYAREYVQSHLRVLHKTAVLQLRAAEPLGPSFEHSTRLTKAVACCEEAIRRQSEAIDRFPRDANLRVWRARFQSTLADAKLASRERSEARKILDGAIADLQRAATDSESPSSPEELRVLDNGQAELWIRLSELLREERRNSDADQAAARAEQLRAIP